MADPLDGYVPVPTRTLEAVAASITATREAERTLARALDALLELTEDLSMDAVRGLRDRGASAAQIERYEAAHRDAARAARDRLNALSHALDAVESASRPLSD